MKKGRRSTALFFVFLFLGLAFLQSCARLPDTEDGEGSDFVGHSDAGGELGTIEFDGRRYSYTGDKSDVEAIADELILKRSGVYRVRGTLTDGRLVASSEDAGVITLVLDGVSVHSSCASPISSRNGTSLVIEVEEGSVNVLSDEMRSDACVLPRACVSADGNITLRGDGSLAINSKNEAAIACGQDFLIEGASLSLSSAYFGIWARDSVSMRGGDLKISNSAVGVCADGGEYSEGVIRISSGRVNAICSEVAFLAGREIEILGGVGNFISPKLYRCERSADGQTLRGSISVQTDGFPKNK